MGLSGVKRCILPKPGVAATLTMLRGADATPSQRGTLIFREDGDTQLLELLVPPAWRDPENELAPLLLSWEQRGGWFEAAGLIVKCLVLGEPWGLDVDGTTALPPGITLDVPENGAREVPLWRVEVVGLPRQRRRFARAYVSLPAELECLELGWVLVRTADISAGGVRLRVPVTLPWTLHQRVRVHCDLHDGGEPAQISGAILRASTAVNAEESEIVVVFDDPAEHADRIGKAVWEAQRRQRIVC